MNFYPNIREETILTLNVVVKSLEKDPHYLDYPDCPYSETIKEFFRRKMAPVEVEDLFAGDDPKEVVLDRQVEQLINDLEAFSKQLTNADHSEKLQYFKTKTTLLEKLVSMRERIFNLKELNEFRSTILTFMDEVCTKDQITELMKRLDGVFGS